MSLEVAPKRKRSRWVGAAAVVLGLWLFGVGVLHIFHGDYVLAPPSFLMATLLLYLGAQAWKHIKPAGHGSDPTAPSADAIDNAGPR